MRRIDLEGSPLDALQLPDIPDGNWGAVAIGVITVALIASVESLLSAVSVDRMHNGPRTDFNRELIGQGAANIVSGTIGGLPITGVIVRSSTNVNAGAKSRASAIMHGVWILLFTIPFAGLIDEIPTAALAGLLIVIGIQLLKPAHIETAMKQGDLAVYVVTAVSVIFLNLLQGVMIGLALAIALTGWRVIRAKIEAKPVGDEWHVVRRGRGMHLPGPAAADPDADIGPGRRDGNGRYFGALPRSRCASGDHRLAATALRDGRHGSDPGPVRYRPPRPPRPAGRIRKARRRRLSGARALIEPESPNCCLASVR